MKSALKPAVLFAMLLCGCAANPADQVPSAQVGSSTPKPASPIASSSAAPNATAATYTIQADKSKVGFVGSKVTGSHEGGFKEFSGKVELLGNNPAGSKVDVEIKVASIFSDDSDLTEHLSSPDFFDAAKFPTATFASRNVTKSGDGYEVQGDLTLHGVTREIRFPARIEASAGEIKVQSEFSINRFDFGMKYPGKADNLIRKEVVIQLDVVATPAS